MADIAATSWSETAAGNSAAPPDGWPENMPRSTVNNTGREMMGAIKRDWNRGHHTRASTGTSTAYVLTYDQAPPPYSQGLTFAFIAHTTCGASPTLNVNAVGAKRLKRHSGAGTYADLKAGDLPAALPVEVYYDNGQDAFIVASPLSHMARIESAVAASADGPLDLSIPADGTVFGLVGSIAGLAGAATGRDLRCFVSFDGTNFETGSVYAQQLEASYGSLYSAGQQTANSFLLSAGYLPTQTARLQATLFIGTGSGLGMLWDMGHVLDGSTRVLRRGWGEVGASRPAKIRLIDSTGLGVRAGTFLSLRKLA